MSTDDPDDARRQDQARAWDAFGLVVSGIAVWGGVGWLVSEWLNSRVFLVLGLLVGMGAALYLVWVRYGKP
ncbi:AtpZ/AtpI family protein [Jiangella asiatica]|uniref:AtpZ/AtpI family protein n=1 Tax=Jiangella asiatica TaxID=2530372 RepID=A0A4R5DNA4_9ACTN|nr:hypothetical protein [Jiangella asiatica]TDE15027.1 hypothetical protein E1269_02665 [Jiangella asiatica]